MPSQSFINTLTKFLSRTPQRQAWVGLDAGCGGHIGVLAEYGLDESPCPNFVIKDYPREKFTQASVYDMPFEDKSFDYVVSAHLIEHLEFPLKAVAEMARVARYIVVANVPRYTRQKEIAKKEGCVSLDPYYFSHFPEKLEEFGLTRDDFTIWPVGATVFAGYEAPHLGWYPYPEDLVELFEKTGCFSKIDVEVCPHNCGENNVYGWI